MCENVVMIDGTIVGPKQAVISVWDRGFLYGDSVFEVLRVYDGRVFALEQHLLRLQTSAARVLLTLPVDTSRIRQEVLQAVEQWSGADASVRVQVTRGVAAGVSGNLHSFKPARVILVSALKTPPTEDYRRGIRVSFVQTQRTADATDAAGAKVGNYLVSLLAVRQASERGGKEAIIVDGRGRVLEGATSNVFALRHRTLYTPPEEEGILPGITRQFVLRAAEKLGIPCKITTLTRGDLLSADEVFISSTSREVLPVVAVDKTIVGDGTIGATTRAIHKAFRDVAGLPRLVFEDEKVSV